MNLKRFIACVGSCKEHAEVKLLQLFASLQLCLGLRTVIMPP